MERSNLKQLNVSSMSARLNSRNVREVYFPNFFDIVPVETLKWETLSSNQGVPVMADIIAYDAASPKKTREVINKATGTIPKISISRSMHEDDLNKYKMLMHYAGNDVNKKALLDLVFNDLDFTYNGVRAKMEEISMKIMSSGALSYSKSQNNGQVIETALDFGVPSANKFGVTVDWDTTASSTPLANLDDLAEEAAADGASLKHFVMRRSDFINLKNATSTATAIKQWLNTTGKVLTTRELINEYMIANDLPTIIVVNPSVRFELQSTHARTTVNPWTQYRVVGIPDVKVGGIQHGPIAIEGSEEAKKVATMVKKDFVLSYKFAQMNPFSEMTISEANAFAVLNDPEALYYLRVDNTTWAD